MMEELDMLHSAPSSRPTSRPGSRPTTRPSTPTIPSNNSPDPLASSARLSQVSSDEGEYDEEKKQIMIIYTGGTLGMKKDEKTGALSPASDYLAHQLSLLPELKSPDMPAYTLVEFSPLLDSSDMTPEEWVYIATLIEESYYDYEGFVVIHGTDTMAYAASALSFMLENLGKTVVITGSQIPFCEVINDARRNLLTSMIIAGKLDVPEVCIFFNNVILRGSRARKLDSWGLTAFESPNCPPLGTLGLEISIPRIFPPPFLFDSWAHKKMAKNIAVLHLVPGFSDEVVGNLLRPPLEGLIIQSYGSGNAPAKKKEFLKLISDAVNRGVVVVVTSQCVRGKVDLKHYATGQSLLAAGAISGHDMTVECAAAKLSYLLSKGYTPEKVRELMEVSLRGELTRKNPKI